jgi:SAM-dependent methyltransferase
VPDTVFEDPRLAHIYDVLEPERPDLDPYLAISREFGARTALDIGCGTGTFACLLARRGIDVIAVDPAAASLEVARQKPAAEKVRWVLGDSCSVPAVQVDLVTMTGNVAQVFLTDTHWRATLRAAYGALTPDGRFVFEVRDPEKEGWRSWTRDRTYRNLDLPGVGGLQTWTDLTDVSLPLVSFRQHFVFGRDGTTVVSDSTLRFRSRSEVMASLLDTGFRVEDIRDAPDRPGLEFVFVAAG